MEATAPILDPTVLFVISDHEINQGLKCPYCNGATVYVDSREVYKKSYGMIYLCKPCNAWVGVHKGTNKALGRLANEELRHWKKEAHFHFDQIARTSLINKVWPEQLPNVNNRNKAYLWLTKQLGIKRHLCHIGMFDVDLCKKVIDICKPFVAGSEFHKEYLKEGSAKPAPVTSKPEKKKSEEINEEAFEWKIVHDERGRKRQKESRTIDLVEQFCTAYKVDLKILESWHLRLKGENKCIDIYPQSQKWFNITEQKWGRYRKVEAFLKESFPETPPQQVQ